MFCKLHFSKVALANGFNQPIFSYVWLICTAACWRSNSSIVISRLWLSTNIQTSHNTTQNIIQFHTFHATLSVTALQWKTWAALNYQLLSQANYALSTWSSFWTKCLDSKLRRKIFHLADSRRTWACAVDSVMVVYVELGGKYRKSPDKRRVWVRRRDSNRCQGSRSIVRINAGSQLNAGSLINARSLMNESDRPGRKISLLL